MCAGHATWMDCGLRWPPLLRPRDPSHRASDRYQGPGHPSQPINPYPIHITPCLLQVDGVPRPRPPGDAPHGRLPDQHSGALRAQHPDQGLLEPHGNHRPAIRLRRQRRRHRPDFWWVAGRKGTLGDRLRSCCREMTWEGQQGESRCVAHSSNVMAQESLLTSSPQPASLPTPADVLTGATVAQLQRRRGGHDATVRDCSWHPTLPMLTTGKTKGLWRGRAFWLGGARFGSSDIHPPGPSAYYDLTCKPHTLQSTSMAASPSLSRSRRWTGCDSQDVQQLAVYTTLPLARLWGTWIHTSPP